MKIENHTKYDTSDLRRFIAAGMRSKGASLENKLVTVRYSRSGFVTGCARLGSPTRVLMRMTATTSKALIAPRREGSRMTLRIPRPPIALDLLELARLISHEVDHLLGYDHRDMVRWEDIQPRWHEGLEVKLATPKMVVKLTREERTAARVAAREKHAREKLAEWESKLARARRKVAEYKRKVSRYDRQAAAGKGLKNA